MLNRFRSSGDPGVVHFAHLVWSSFWLFAGSAATHVQVDCQLEICWRFLEEEKAFLETEFAEPIERFIEEVGGDDVLVFACVVRTSLEAALLYWSHPENRRLYGGATLGAVKLGEQAERGRQTSHSIQECQISTSVGVHATTGPRTVDQTVSDEHLIKRPNWDQEVYDIISTYRLECKNAGVTVPSIADIYRRASIDKATS